MTPKLQASSWGRNESICGGVDTPKGLDLGALSPGDMDTRMELFVQGHASEFSLFCPSVKWSSRAGGLFL